MLDRAIFNDQFILALRLLIASLCGLAVGVERRIHLKSAGEKTHIIVALAAALMMEVSKYGFFDIDEADKSRIAAQVVSGVSFLGAGIIFKRNQNIEGLTTAAGIWMTAGIGLAIGAGMYATGLVCTCFFVFFNFVVRRTERQKRTYPITYSMNVTSQDTLPFIIRPYKQSNMIQYSSQQDEEGYHLEMTLVFRKPQDCSEWEQTMINHPHITSFERIL